MIQQLIAEDVNVYLIALTDVNLTLNHVTGRQFFILRRSKREAEIEAYHAIIYYKR
jgi:hypothetical protein